jgi:hypothetical protein
MLPLQQAYEVPNSKLNLDLDKFKIVNYHANFLIMSMEYYVVA